MKNKLFQILGEIIGVDPEDIHEQDDLRDELHMSSVDLAELTEKLAEEGLGAVDLSEIETVEELLEELGEEDI